MAFFIVVVGIFVFNSVSTRSHYRNWVVNHTIERAKSDIYNRTKLTRSTFDREVEALALNQSLAKALKNGNSEELFLMSQPVFSRLNGVGKERIFLGLYGINGHLIVGFNDSLELKMNSNEMHSSFLPHGDQITGYDLGNGGLFHFIASPVFYLKTLVGYIQLGIRDDDYAQMLGDSLNFRICNIVTIDKEKAFLFANKESINTSRTKFLLTYGDDSLFSKALSLSNGFNNKTISFNNQYYTIFQFGRLNLRSKNCSSEVFAAVDVTDMVTGFQSYLLGSILLSLGFLLLLFLLLRVLFHMPLKVIDDLQNNLEKKVSERSKEIIDTNTELQQIFNSTANGIRIIDLNFNVIRVNDSFCSISGYPRDAVEGKMCFDFFGCKHCHTADCSIERIKSGVKRVEFEEIKVNVQRNMIKCIHVLVPFFGSNDELIGVIEEVKDVTEKMVMENALVRTEEQQNTFFNNLNIGVFIKSVDQTMIYQNDAMNNLFGRIALGEKMGLYVSEKMRQRWRCEDESVLVEGSLSVEEKLIDRFGNERTFLTQKFKFNAVDGSERIGGIMIDTTSMVDAEKKLRIMSKAINASPLSMVITNTSGTVEQTNPAFSEIAGYSSGESLGMHISTCVFPGHERLINNEIFPTVLGGNTWKGELLCAKKSGEEIWISAAISPVRDRHENIRHILILYEDVTFRKEYERVLHKSKEKAEESDKLKMAFLSNISHEIRTPLNAIVGFNNLLATSDDISSEERLRLVKIINQNSSQLLRIIENTIDISKFETEQFKVLTRPCNLNELMESLFCEVFEQGLVSNSVKLSIRKELAESGLTILTDGFRLKQVIENLLTNALMHTTNGFVEFGYTLSDPNTLLFYVVDSGVGIPEERQSTLFKPFTPGASRTNENGGLGVGLPLTKKILTCMGGDIWFKSSMGSGSSFYFSIPLLIANSKYTVEKEHHCSVYPEWLGKQILIADDLEENYYLLKSALKNTKATIHWARNGFQAVNMFRDNPDIDIVLMDLRMPVMDGYKATEEIRILNGEIPVICQTAFADAEESEKISNSGFNALFTKPIGLSSIIDKIDSLLKN